MKASRHGRYRKHLLAPQSLLPIAPTLEIVFNNLDQKRQAGVLSDAEFLSYGLLTLLACRRLNAFQNDKTKHRAFPENDTTTRAPVAAEFTLSDFWNLLCAHNLPVSSYEKILNQQITVYRFLNRIRFRGIPDSAQMALLKWLDNQYPLTLMFHVPSATEVFELQKQGGRCISFFKRACELTEFHHHRDTLSFTVHDLIHAHEFYANPQRARQQIGFYHWLDTIKNNPELLKLQTESAEFLERWEYVLSDMNSYCGHLLKTLNAAFAIYAHESLWKSIVDSSDLAPQEKILFQKINSAVWNDADFLQLESVLENRWQL